MSVTVGSSLASQIGVVVVLADAFGVEGMGVYAFNFALASLFGLVSTFGFPVYLQRELSARIDRFDEIHNDALSLKVLIDVSLLALALIVPVIFTMDNVWLFDQLLLARILFAYSNFLLVEFRVLDDFKAESLLTVLGNLFYFFGVAAVAYGGGDLFLVGSVLLLVRLLVLLLVLRVWSKLCPGRLFAFGCRRLTATFRKNIPYSMDQGVSEFLVHSVAFIVGFVLGEFALGIYQAGMRIVSGVLTLAGIVMGTFVSKLTQLWVWDKQLYWKELRRASWLFHGVGICGFLILFFGGDLITHVLFGEAFIVLNDLWLGFALYLGIRYFAATPGLILLTAGFQNIRVAINTGSTVLIVCLLPFVLKWTELFGVITLLVVAMVFVTISYYAVIINLKINSADE